MNAEHTPGPWTIKRSLAPSDDGCHDFAILDAENQIILEAFQRVGEADFRPAEANARLAAAAPELADALEAALRCIGRYAYHVQPETMQGEAALKKAGR